MERETTHLVVIVHEVTPFRLLEDAEEFFYDASTQWTESYLASVVYGPGHPFFGTERSNAAGQRICARRAARDA